ncbi:hypothetical protein C7S20_14575 [Christiangramia fulva]|uniref:histidine kinase n=1 Tax=Christiangramia fulva TaxID=2126553 RepID=A0A2R3Z7Y6_9FLAO|nr:ATP-binding protein [Christiangramia fulva]AVR46390.1 hypothetical protein C7S20_14575 [Christiangramia fulva]
MTEELRIKELEKELSKSHRENEYLKEQLDKGDAFELHQYKTLVHSSPSMITLLKGEDLIIEVANDAVLNFWNKSRDIIGKPLVEAHPDIKEQGLENLLLEVYEKGEARRGYEMPVYISRESGRELLYFNFIYQPQRDQNGKIYGVAVIAHEVSSQAVLHKELKKSEDLYRSISDFMPHKISISDKNGNSYYYNQSWLDYTGRSLDELIEKEPGKMLHHQDWQNIQEIAEKSLKSGRPFEVECRIKDKNKEYKWHLCQIAPLKDQEGNVEYWISSAIEIQKMKEEEKRKEDFLKLVSHELKTPVTSIKGYIQLLQSMLGEETEENKVVKPYLNRIEGQIERLIRLISEMLDLSRIEQNEMELKLEKFLLNDLVEEIIEDFSYTNKNLRVELNHYCECNVSADKDRIGQVIVNLITNAIKYSGDDKRIEVRVFHPDRNHVGVGVKDFGIGISDKDKKLVFNRFFRVPSQNEETYSGFGIGLYLSKQIIHRHHGEIFVNSEPGKGSEFIFTLPLEQN